MFGRTWKLSDRKYDVIRKPNVFIPVSDGVAIDTDQFFPDTKEKVPAVLGVFAYGKGQTMYAVGNESGFPDVFCRRGYAHIIMNVRGSAKSGGQYTNYGPREVQDVYEIIEWLADQPWCDGNVVMWGLSYYGVAQYQVAALRPPHLRAIMPINGYTDFYRMRYYHGGILLHDRKGWAQGVYWDSQGQGFASWSRERMGEAKYRAAIADALQDKEIAAVPYLVDALQNPDYAEHPLLVDMILNPFDTEYYRERSSDPVLSKITVPTYLVGHWRQYESGQSIPYHAWERIQAPKKMIVYGPPIRVDANFNTLLYEAIRWYDYHVKGIDNGIMEEPPITLFVSGANGWRTTTDWPLPETIWTPFYLHPKGLLWEVEPWPEGGSSWFEDSIVRPGGCLKFRSEPLVQDVEAIGSSVVNLYAASTTEEVLWFIGLLDVDAEGQERLLTEGWLRGSMRAVDPAQSKPWEPYHPFLQREPLVPGEIYEFNIHVEPTAHLFKAGHRIGLRVGCTDPEPAAVADAPTPPHPFKMAPPQRYMDASAHHANPQVSADLVSVGHFWSRNLWNMVPKVVTVYHNAEHASHLALPITRGHVVGTYVNYSLHLRG